MRAQYHQRMSCSLTWAVAFALLLSRATAIFLPIVPLPISFNFGGASPMSMDVACSWGTVVEVDGAKQVRQGCGGVRHAWKVVQETGQGSGSEVPLGALAGQQKLTLNLSPNRAAGVLSRPGTYLVQLTLTYERCTAEQGQTRVNVGPCPSSDEGSSTQSYDLQSCKDVTEPGKRKLTLSSQGSNTKNINWQLVPQAGSSSVNTEAGATGLGCSGSQCVLLVGSGQGKVNPGRSYAIKYSTDAAAAAAAAQQQGSGIGFSLGLGGFGFGFGAGGGASGSSSGSSGSSWRELKGPQVDKCPPRVTRSTAAVMGKCGSNRWLEMQAAAVDLEEGAAGQQGLKYYWYVLSARTQDVVQEAAGPSVKLDIGQGTGKVPDSRRYLISLVVTAQSGGQVATHKQTVGSVLDVPAC